MRRAFGRTYEKRNLTLAVCAVAHGCGTTHLALSFANYFASWERRTTAYLECADSGEDRRDRSCGQEAGVIRLRTKHMVTAADIAGFTRDGVDYMPRLSGEDSKRLLAQRKEYFDAGIRERGRKSQEGMSPLLGRYEVIVLEVCEWSKEADALLDVCDLCYFVGSTKPWRYRELQEFMRTKLTGKDILKGRLCVFGLTGREERAFQSEFGLRLMRIPMIEDPFALTRKEIEMIAQMARV